MFLYLLSLSFLNTTAILFKNERAWVWLMGTALASQAQEPRFNPQTEQNRKKEITF